MIEEVHECNVCRGRFSDAELLRTHVCPLREGNEFIELAAPAPESYAETAPDAGTVPQADLGPIAPSQPIETRLGNPYGSGDAAIAIGQDAWMAAWDAAVDYISTMPADLWGSNLKNNPGVQIAKQMGWAKYEPPEDIKALA